MIWDIQLRPHDISLTNPANKALIELSTSSNAVERLFVAKVFLIALVAAKVFDAAAHLTAAASLIIRLLFGVRPSEARTEKGEATIGAAVAELGRHLYRVGAHGVTLPMTFFGGLVSTKNAILAQTTFGLGARTFKQVRVTVDPALEPIPVVHRLPEPTPEPTITEIPVEHVEPSPEEEGVPPPPPAPPLMPEKSVEVNAVDDSDHTEEQTNDEEVAAVDETPSIEEENVEDIPEAQPPVVTEEEINEAEEDSLVEEAAAPPPPPPPPIFDNEPQQKRPRLKLRKAASIAAFDRSRLKNASQTTNEAPKPQSSHSESLGETLRRGISSRRSALEQNGPRDSEVATLLTSIIKGEDAWEDEEGLSQFDELVQKLFPEGDEESEGLEILENELSFLANVLQKSGIEYSVKRERILEILPQEKPGENTDARDVYERLTKYANKRQFELPDGSFTRPIF